MRILVDIDEPLLRRLDRLARRERRSRAAMVREAIAEYLDRRAPHVLDNAFGLWGERKTDGFVYQEKARSEW
ncbi:ribbon-helix-helix protein, CopG family [Mesorhizobium sp. WSM2239]|uniref:Ribbon-helix-helix protein, CopG family n=2 Tax=unclassified Mesorhizobium TaxID=325217 RepID=A0AAU8DCN6_9HYPH